VTKFGYSLQHSPEPEAQTYYPTRCQNQSKLQDRQSRFRIAEGQEIFLPLVKVQKSFGAQTIGTDILSGGKAAGA
jgi:hypothetical protein